MTRDPKLTDKQADALADSWEKHLTELNSQLRASGRTVTVREPSDTTEFVVTVPQGRRLARSGPASGHGARQPPQGRVDIDAVLPVLAASKRACAALVRELGKARAAAAWDAVASGMFDAALDDARDFFVDEIRNSSRVAWEGLMRGGDGDEYPVQVEAYEGAFLVWAMGFDRVGYFLSVAEAKQYIFGNWDGVREADGR